MTQVSGEGAADRHRSAHPAVHRSVIQAARVRATALTMPCYVAQEEIRPTLSREADWPTFRDSSSLCPLRNFKSTPSYCMLVKKK